MSYPIRISTSDDRPIYRQIVDQVKKALLTGKLKPGQKLPSHRELAIHLVVAPLTVKAAYTQLETEGWVLTKRGLGTFLTEINRDEHRKQRETRLDQAIDQLIKEAQELGLSTEDVIQRIKVRHTKDQPS